MFVVAPRFINEIAWVPDDKLDNHTTHNELLQTRYTMHRSLEADPYYLDVVGKQLTRNIGACFLSDLERVLTNLSFARSWHV